MIDLIFTTNFNIETITEEIDVIGTYRLGTTDVTPCKDDYVVIDKKGYFIYCRIFHYGIHPPKLYLIVQEKL